MLFLLLLEHVNKVHLSTKTVVLALPVFTAWLGGPYRQDWLYLCLQLANTTTNHGCVSWNTIAYYSSPNSNMAIVQTNLCQFPSLRFTTLLVLLVRYLATCHFALPQMMLRLCLRGVWILGWSVDFRTDMFSRSTTYVLGRRYWNLFSNLKLKLKLYEWLNLRFALF